MAVSVKPAQREDVAGDDEWVVVKDQSIERGWGMSLFRDRCMTHSASEGARRIDRALVKHGYAKTLGEAKAMVTAGRIAIDGVPAMKADERAELGQLTIDGRALD